MKIATGIDIIEVDRIKKAIENLGDTFLQRIFTQKEIEYCNKAGENYNIKYQRFAARFVAKEATFKAISQYIQGREDALWKEIEIVDNEDGKPFITVDKLRKNNLENLQSIDVSMSHIKDYAVASVTALFE